MKMKSFSGSEKTNPNKANFKRGGYAALRSSYKKTLLFALNLVKWTLGDMRQRQLGCSMLDAGYLI